MMIKMNSADNNLKNKILDLMNRADFMTLSTSVFSHPSAANVYFANDDLDIYFFTFNPTRKAVQINFNPKVQIVIRPDGEEGIKELQIDGYASKIVNPSEKEKAKEMILKVTTAFEEYMNDQFLIDNDVVGYYKVSPTLIKYVDFYAEKQFEWLEIPENNFSIFSELKSKILNSLKYWVTIIRAPFLTATVVPVILGSVIGFSETGIFNWSLFWPVLLGASFAHIGTNTINDYFDHLSRNDENNKLFSPFNGGSRAIQSGLISPLSLVLFSYFCFALTIYFGCDLNNKLYGDYFAASPLMYIGIAGILLGILYTGYLRLSYNGLGDLAVFLGFGPLMVVGSNLVQNPNSDLIVSLVFSIPVGILIALVLFINCFQDYSADKSVNKNSWVVRLAGPNPKANYRKPFKVWRISMIIAFIIIGISSAIFNPLALIALLPIFLFNSANKKGLNWLLEWEKDNADLQKLPYELLIVNVSTIGIHFLTGLLLSLGFIISSLWI